MKLKGIAFKGLDISHFQSNINLSDVKKDGFAVCYLKATEGEHSKDSEVDNLFKKARAAGLKIGFYHFFHTGGGYDAVKQAENFLKILSAFEYDCLPVVDIEMGGYHGGDKAAITADVLKFAETIKAKTGHNCILYSNTAFIAEHMTSAVTQLPLWVAHYGVSAPGENGIYSEYIGWQYSGSTPYGGCSAVDMDNFCDSVIINASKPTVSTTAAKAKTSSDVYKVSTRPYDWNATAKTDFDVRDRNGKHIGSHEVNNGDRFEIISVDYDNQLAEIVYPVSGGFMHGYIRNLQNLISDRWHFQWHNGSTPETVYNSDGEKIGTIFAHENATPLYRRGGRTAVLYNTEKGEETKFGFVDYGGKFTF